MFLIIIRYAVVGILAIFPSLPMVAQIALPCSVSEYPRGVLLTRPVLQRCFRWYAILFERSFLFQSSLNERLLLSISFVKSSRCRGFSSMCCGCESVYLY